VYGSRGYAGGTYGSRGFVGRGVYAGPSHFYSPYYSFRPRFSLGFGLWVGYPFAYSYPFYDGYPYPYYYDDPSYDSYPYPAYPPAPPPGYYGDPAQGNPPAAYPPQGQGQQQGYYEPDPGQMSVTARPGSASGGVSFDMTPSNADVYIDGKFAGKVSDLGPTTQPLGLTPGRHHVEIRASGYQTMSVDADVIAGQVIPYQGQMQRQ
jgi:hypothetical protein